MHRRCWKRLSMRSTNCGKKSDMHRDEPRATELRTPAKLREMRLLDNCNCE
jgi:hypothetical protein